MAVPGKKASQKFSSTLSQGGAEDFDIYCEICDRDDIRLPAFGYCVDCEEHLCQSCFNTHRRPKPLRHHQLLDKDHMPHKQKFQRSSKSTSSLQTGDFTKPCNKHTKEVIKFYCHDHNAVICSVCVTIEHTPTSCHVDYIPDISGQVIDSTEFRETLKDIDILTYKYSQITSDMKQRVGTSTTALKYALAEFENFRKEINKRLDELEKEVKDTATTIQQDNNKKLKTTEAACDDINKSLQASADTLKHFNVNKKTDQLFAELKRAQQLIQDNNKIISQLPTINDIDDYIFEPNQAIKQVFQNEKSLGKLCCKELKQTTEPNKQGAVEMKMSTTPRRLNAKLSSDEMDCNITGIAVSPLNQLFAADCYYNQSIKMIDINSGTIKQLKLKSSPWDITMVTTDSLAVTLPDSKTIQFISFSQDSLSLKNKLEVDAYCYGISHHQGKLAVTYPAKLQIMDLKGIIEITVEKDSKGYNIFSSPEFVTTNSHSIYVSDCRNNVVLRFNWQGEMIGLVVIKEPMGITLLHDGSLLVNGCSSDCIYRVSGDCKDSKTILEDADRPYAACWCAETSTFCVSRLNDDSDDNYIKLYKMM
ncbi:E3 ubiquitin-protein ligase TRIM71-like isoform X2 [Ruditapes philippinarum]|uniref:E3 ubiquitin-protein ligase TRIM71-like isoform X2 n=1 Tax=Ruditapes philippinarum TaxID=129788 RepID=UPI00295B79E5|nr:E3 ubiquitin-protein ligase TRIM71-like isoform X2 [Ruditapes philippinarum]